MKFNVSSKVVLIKPMYLVESLLWFGGWASVLLLSVYGLMPQLSSTLTDFEKFAISMTLPLVFIFITAIATYWIQNGHNIQGFRARYRIDHINLKDIGLGVGLSVVALVCMGAFSVLGLKLIEVGLIPVPKNLSLFLDPEAVFNLSSLNQAVGGQICGNWKVLFIYFIMLFFNIAGEELLWRGYILPRQELAYGKKAWLVHGLLWTMFHSFKWWDMISLLPVCLLISFIAQKRKSIWPGFIAHYIINGMGFIMFLEAVLGAF